MSRSPSHPSPHVVRGLLAVALCAVVGAAASAQVSFRSTTDDTFKVMSRAELRANLETATPTVADKSRVVVSFDRPILDSEKSTLSTRGMMLLTYLGGNNWIASLTAQADPNALAATPALINLRSINPAWKLETSLAQGNPPSWTILDAGNNPDEAENPRAADEKSGDPLVAVYIDFHADVPLGTEARDLLHDLKIDARSFVRSTNLVVAHARLSQIRQLVQHDIVMWVEPAEPAWTDYNNSNRERTQAEQLQQAPYGLTGAGIDVMVYDGGTVRPTHETFRDGNGGSRVTVHDASGTADHSTHVAGTIAGRGEPGTGLHRGMAPDATIISYGFEVPGGLSQGFLYTDPGDLNADFDQAINTYGADLSNASIGSNTAPNGFPCAWEGNYGNTAALIDTIARGSLGRKMIMVWAAGNERQGFQACGGSYGTTAPPGNAKNQIAVGALNSNDDSVTSFTSWGPDDAGRMRPDISAPGCQSGPDSTGPNDDGVTSSGSGSDTTYNVKCGTSMASPTVAGCVALLLQDYRLNFSGDPDPLPSTVKTLLAHNAIDVAQPGPDNQSGYGSIRIKDTVDFMRSGNFTESEVTTGATSSFLVYVAPGDPEFKATIAWDDAPAAVFAAPTLVNNLDLVVIDPNGNRQYPWTLNPANPGANAVRTQPNTLDNIEQVFVANPTPGVWQVNVVGTNVPVGPQTFSLAASPLLINCSTAGIVTLDRSVYSCGSSVSIRVSDCDLNTDDNAIDTVVVHLSSDSDPVGEMVVLTETGPLTADFRATVPTAASGSSGVLGAVDGDIISVTYLDADDGFGHTNVTVFDSASFDCTPPVISNIVVSPTAFDASIAFNTNENATVMVDFGESCANLNRTSTGPRNTAHNVALGGLNDGTQYSYTITATDDAGNTTVVGGMGSCLTFSTTDIPTYFVEVFTTSHSPDLSNTQLAFTPEPGNIDFYSGCAQEYFAFEIDPAGGTSLPLTTSNSIRVNLTGGAMVRLYGQQYSGFWVNAAGNITFDSADSDTTETIGEHFAHTRIAPFFDGLNSGAGTVSWKQTADAAVVTWQNVQDNFTANTSLTFQVVMYFDGKIELNYLNNIANDGLVGLSPGGGTPVGFEAIDLSALSSCGPRPPFANNADFQTPANTNLAVNLPGSDDGLPAPGALAYRIESLPAHGRLYDSTNTQITTVPTLIPTDAVTYHPSFNYIGLDSFDYSLNDGGVPPDGGVSNVGTIDITVGGPTPVYTQNFNTNPGWTTQGQWAFGQPTGQGSHGRDPTSGFTGNFVYGYNLNGDYIDNMPAYNLTSTPFDCSNLSGVQVSFYRWLGVESSQWDFARFQVSNNGSTWTTLFTNPLGVALDETSWTQVSYDISALADGQPTVYLRWVMGVTDTSQVYHGWNIDDLAISALVPLPECTGDTNGDGIVNFADLNAVLAAFGQTGANLPGDANHDGAVNFADLNTVLAAFGADCN